MKNSVKKKRNGLKLTLAIVLLIIIFVFIYYFFWSWGQLSDQEIPLTDVAAYDYYSSDKQYSFRFIDTSYIVFATSDNRYVFDYRDLNYEAGIIEINTDNERFLFAVLNENRIYNNKFNVLFYAIN